MRLPKNWQTPCLCLLLISVTLAVLSPLLRCDFIKFDDGEYVTENPHVLSGVSWASAAWAFRTTYASNWHPITWLSHMLDVQLFGTKPAGHHLVNLLFHSANAVFLFLLLKRMTGFEWRSYFVAALFALHPLHVESVAWIAERKDVLSTSCLMLSLWAYSRYVSSAWSGGAINPKSEDCQQLVIRSPWPRMWYILALVLFALGLMSKPMLVTIPFLLLLLDFWPLKRCELASYYFSFKSLRRLLWEKVPFFVLALACAIITLFAQEKAVSRLGELPVDLRLASAVMSCLRYLCKTIWPADLAIFYPHRAVYYPPSEQWPWWMVASAGVLLIGISISALLLMRKQPWIATGWFWYLITLLPVIGLVQVGRQEMADRYTYIPLIGIFTCVVWSVGEFCRTRQYSGIALIAVGCVTITACATVSRCQCGYWKDNFTVFKHALAVTVYNSPAHYHVGVGLAKQGDYRSAAREFQEALRLDVEDADAHFNLGRVQMEMGQLNEAVSEYHAAVRLKPLHPLAHKALGAGLWRLGQHEAALAEYSRAIQITPADAELQYLFGAGLRDEGKLEDAVTHFGEAVRLKPDYAAAHEDLGLLLGREGKLNEAAAQFKEQLRAQPNARAYCNLARSLALLGNLAESVTNYYQAIASEPDWAAAHNSLAWILASAPDATVRNGAEAVRHAERACQLTGGKEVRYLATLDISYAEAGRFNEAIATAQKARDLARATGKGDLARAAERREAVYRKQQPYRE